MSFGPSSTACDSMVDGSVAPPWRVMIIDDEPEVHEVTRLVLGDFRFENRGLDFLHAYSAAEARDQLSNHSDVAVVLLDVVMESEQAGLELVHFIRRELDNPHIRIVLRTGQPGQAPEREVVARYDINDYKEKTELTSERLFTTLYATLRAYRDVVTIEASRRGLERVIESSAQVFSHPSIPGFGALVLDQLGGFLGSNVGALYCRVPKGEPALDGPVVKAASGCYSDLINGPLFEQLPESAIKSVKKSLKKRHSIAGEDHYVLHLADDRQPESLLFVFDVERPGTLDHQLLEIFCANVSIAFKNLMLSQELNESQSEMLCLLAGVAETRSLETANHVKRVGELAAILADAYGLDGQETEMIRLAAPLHDIGKIGIPDAVLNKPGPHSDQETRTMRQHVRIGAEMLSSSSRPLFEMAARIASDHHENWDGSGYPRGIAGEEISLAGRIVALADVCDALGSRRCYKEPWPEERVKAYLQEKRGSKFDPKLVDLLMDRWSEVRDLRNSLPD